MVEVSYQSLQASLSNSWCTCNFWPLLGACTWTDLFFFCGWCLLGARGPSASSLLGEQQLQKYLQCNLMRLIKHCECKHDQIYRAACVPQPPGAAVDGDGDSHHLSLGKRAQLASQTSPCFYAALGIHPVGMQPGWACWRGATKLCCPWSGQGNSRGGCGVRRVCARGGDS